jgi:uncharacterized membrane protein HdeD (DUF308 family)
VTDWRERATAIREEGTLARRDWSPSADSFHWKIYQWWRTHDGKAPLRENWCHYFWVVVFWAPLKWVTQPLRSYKFWAAVGILAATLVVLGLVLVTVKWPSEFFGTVGVLLGAAWIVTGLAFFIHCFGMLTDERSPFGALEWLEDKNYGIYALIALFYLPVMAAALLFCLAAFVILGLLIAPFEHYKVHKRLARMHPAKYPWFNPYTALGAAIGLWVVYLAFAGNTGAQMLVAAVAGVAALFGIVFFVSWLFDIVKRNNAAKRRELSSRLVRDGVNFLIRARFELQHPDQANDEAKFEAWQVRYLKHFNSRYGEPYSSFNAQFHVWYIEQMFYRKYPSLMGGYTRHPDSLELARRNATAPVTQKGPSLGSKIVDFGSFVWSVVLVNKWRTCPIIETPVATH